MFGGDKMNEEDVEKIRKEFDDKLRDYDYYYANSGFEDKKMRYIYVAYIYKGNIRKLKSEVIVIILDTKTGKIKVEVHKYLAEDIYIKIKPSQEELFEYLEDEITHQNNNKSEKMGN